VSAALAGIVVNHVDMGEEDQLGLVQDAVMRSSFQGLLTVPAHGVVQCIKARLAKAPANIDVGSCEP